MEATTGIDLDSIPNDGAIESATLVDLDLGIRRPDGAEIISTLIVSNQTFLHQHSKIVRIGRVCIYVASLRNTNRICSRT